MRSERIDKVSTKLDDEVYDKEKKTKARREFRRNRNRNDK